VCGHVGVMKGEIRGSGMVCELFGMQPFELVRNHMIFRNEVKHVDELLPEIIVKSWQWSLSRLNMQTCLYYEWNWNPQECLLRK